MRCNSEDLIWHLHYLWVVTLDYSDMLSTTVDYLIKILAKRAPQNKIKLILKADGPN